MQFQQNQKITITGGVITLTGPVTVGSITNPVTVANDVIVVIPAFFGAPFPVNVTNAGPTQTCSGMRLLMAMNLGNVVLVTVTNQTTLDSFSCTVKAATTNTFGVFIPIAADTNDGIRLQIALISGISTVNYEIIGLSQSPDIATPPGAPIEDYTIGGTLKSVVTSVAGNVSVLPAPPSGMAYRLHRICVFNGHPGWLIDANVTPTTYAAVSNTGVGNGGDVNLNGVLCTSLLQWNSANAGDAVTLHYDLISLPLLQ